VRRVVWCVRRRGVKKCLARHRNIQAADDSNPYDLYPLRSVVYFPPAALLGKREGGMGAADRPLPPPVVYMID
jgi:hypothetical protein